MHYTLDSEEHVKACLTEQYPHYQVTSKPVIFAGQDLHKLQQENNQYFFGVLTVSEAVIAELTYNGQPVITIESGSQAIIDFTQAVFKDSSGSEIDPKVLFRGFQITLQTP